MRRRTCYRIIIKGSLANTHGGQMTDSGQNLRKLLFRERNQGKMGKSLRIQGV